MLPSVNSFAQTAPVATTHVPAHVPTHVPMHVPSPQSSGSLSNYTNIMLYSITYTV